MHCKNPEISIILPVYNCYTAFAKGIGSLKQRLKELGLTNEIIVVNDGSEIYFDPINEEVLKHDCKLISYRKNQGKGYAVRQGVKAASGKVIMYIDGDLPFDLKIINDAMVSFKNQQADIVIGNRTIVSSIIEANKNFRKFGSKIVSNFSNLMLIKNIPDTQCGFKAFKKEVAKSIFSKQKIRGYSFDIEILFLAQQLNYKIYQIPVVVNKQYGSSVKLIWHGFQMMLNIVSIKLKSKFYKISE
jgi:dolichyl-phosphate beta-glucosyltransferase